MKIAIIGAGNLGTQHARAALNFGAQIVAVHDARIEAAQKLADEFGALATTELNEVFAHDVDGAVIATPPPIRLEPVRAACERGTHLFIEKPPAFDLDEGRACLELIENSNIMAAAGFNLRYEKRYEQLRELIAGREVHLVRTACAINYYLDFPMAPWFLQKRVSGGPIAEQAIHLLDCVRYIFGNARARRALAVGAKNMALERAEFDAENALQIVYELDNGIFATHLNHCGHEKFHFDLELIGPHLWLCANLTDNCIRGEMDGARVEIPVLPNDEGRLEAWLRALESGDESLIRAPYRDALNTQALVDAAIKSQCTNCFEKVEIP